MAIGRYHRQVLLPQVGPDGQAQLARSRVLLVGCGALGSAIAEQLVRAGIGSLRIADRDIVELTNLQRQVLFDESDVAEQAPKAIAAARRLHQINSEVRVEPLVCDVHAGNVESLLDCDLIVDGTDNVETRYLLNDVSVKHGISWVYGACVGTEGRCMTIRPPADACLRCVFPDPPAAGELPTCDTAGVLGAAAAMVASLQVTSAIRLLVTADHRQELVTLDIWKNRFHSVPLSDAKRSDCLCCGQRRFDFLDGASAGRSTSLCGRNAIQVRPSGAAQLLDLATVADKLTGAGAVQRTDYLVRCDLHEPRELRLTIFPDGRAIVHGTADPDRAKSIYARFVGS
jgi:molybdopterin/thiamine biosynthesis adenylyltransferase